MLRLTRNVLRQIDDWRRVQDDLPNRQEAIRRILKDGLGRRR